MSLENLLARILNNEASNEEKAQLESWKLEGEENLKALEEMRAIWDDASEMKDYQEFNENKAWQKINSAIVTEELQQPAKKESFFIVRRLMPMAASLLLLIAVGLGVKSYLASGTSGVKQLSSFVSDENSSKDILLEDETKVLLDKNSKLEVLSDFGKSRVVSLSGRAYYDVRSDVKNPFTIKTSHGDVTVVGTEFTLNTSADRTELFLYEGKVKYTHKGKTIDLQPSEAIRVENGEVLKYRFNQQNAKSWITDKIIFEDVSISEVFKTLEQHYGVSISTIDKFVDAKCTMSSVYEDVSLTEILDEMSVFFSFEYSNDSDQIVIKKLSC